MLDSSGGPIQSVAGMTKTGFVLSFVKVCRATAAALLSFVKLGGGGGGGGGGGAQRWRTAAAVVVRRWERRQWQHRRQTGVA